MLILPALLALASVLATPATITPAPAPTITSAPALFPRQDRLRCLDTCAALIFAVRSPCDPTRYGGLREVLLAGEMCARQACPVSYPFPPFPADRSTGAR